MFDHTTTVINRVAHWYARDVREESFTQERQLGFRARDSLRRITSSVRTCTKNILDYITSAWEYLGSYCNNITAWHGIEFKTENGSQIDSGKYYFSSDPSYEFREYVHIRHKSETYVFASTKIASTREMGRAETVVYKSINTFLLAIPNTFKTEFKSSLNDRRVFFRMITK